MLTRISKAYDRYIWQRDLRTLPAHQRVFLFSLRLLQILIQDFADGQVTLRAMSLVYTTLLALVPLLAIVFAALKALGVQENLEPVLFNLLAPLGEKGEILAGRIINFVDNIKVGVLGILGVLTLLYAVFALVQKVESGLNYVWRVREARSFRERASHYVMVMVIGPLLVVAAFALTATVSSRTVTEQILALGPGGHWLLAATKIVPYLLAFAAFTFTYIFIPHTYVRFRAALAGGIVAGVFWELAGWAFATLTVSSTRLTAIYSGFAILIMFMAWIYLCWVILFVGAQVAFYAQNPELVRHGHGHEDIGGRTLERLALHIMYLIGRRFHGNRPPWSREDLARRLRVPTETVIEVLGRLRARGLVIMISGSVRRYLPGRDLGQISLRDIVGAVRLSAPGAVDVDRYISAVDAVDGIMNKLDAAYDSALGDISLRDLVEKQAIVELADRRRA